MDRILKLHQQEIVVLSGHGFSVERYVNQYLVRMFEVIAQFFGDLQYIPLCDCKDARKNQGKYFNLTIFP